MITPFISICIPSYQRVAYLKRLLDSITIQTFTSFEVIITDDSKTGEVEKLCKEYNRAFEIKYIKNFKTLGTPENWNECIRNAKGEWVKIMHDDDWFVDSNSLSIFADFAKNSDAAFVFSSFVKVSLPKWEKQFVSISSYRLRKLKQNPVNLLSSNRIGVPSVTMYKRSIKTEYDTSLSWLVDIDFYIRVINNHKFLFIDKYLISVGMSETQVTAIYQNDPQIEIPEYLSVLSKTGISHLQHILVYDAWWRLIRNFRIKDFEHLKKYARHEIPVELELIISDVNRWPGRLLRIGFFSKIIMSISFLKNRRRMK